MNLSHTTARPNQTEGNMLTREDWMPYDQAAAAISFLLAAAIVGLNGWVIYTLMFRTHKKSRLFFFILHLAIADMLVGLVCCLGDGIQSAMYGDWVGGDVVCRLWRYSKFVLLMASNNLLIGMSVDRYIAIRYPLHIIRVGMCSFLDKGMVIGAWVISLLTPSWLIYYFKGVNGSPFEGGGCDVTFNDNYVWEVYLVVCSAVIVLLPLVVVAVCYTGICVVVWSKWRKGLALSEMHSDNAKVRLQGGKPSNTGLLPKAKIKTIKMTFVICLSFLFCWLPYLIFTFLDLYGYQWLEQRLYMVIGYLYPLNSACNPFIFIIFNAKLFRGEQKDQKQCGGHYEGYSTQMTST